MPPPLGSVYQKVTKKAASYTLTVSDDVVEFTTAAPGVVATLPLAKDCTIVSGQNKKIIASKSTSSNDLTIAVQSGNTLVGVTGALATLTLSAGQTAYLRGDQSTVWNVTGGIGTSGVSGYSGFSGASGYSGISGGSGWSGRSGPSGFSGFSGITGISGFSGFTGVSGFSGYSGKSGYSGFTGFSGISGF